MRILHKESDVFLAADHGKSSGRENTRTLLVGEPACGFGSVGYAANARETAGTSYTLWIIENLDPTVSCPLRYGSGFRLRNLATGGYLLNHFHSVAAGGGDGLESPRSPRSPRRDSGFNTARSGFSASGPLGQLYDQRNTRAFAAGALGESEAGAHVGLCGQERSLLGSTRSILSLHTSQTFNEGQAAGKDLRDAATVESKSMVYIQFERLQPSTTRAQTVPRPFLAAEAAVTAAGALASPSTADGAALGAGETVAWLQSMAPQALTAQALTASATPGDWGSVFGPRSHLAPVPGAPMTSLEGGLAGAGVRKRQSSTTGNLPTSPAYSRPSSSAAAAVGVGDSWGQIGWLKIDGVNHGVRKPKPGIGTTFMESDGWLMYVADKDEVRDVQYVSSICRKVDDFMRVSRGVRALRGEECEEMTGLFLRLQRFLTFSAVDKAVWNADDPRSGDQVTRRQGIMYDMGLVDLLVSLCCNLEQFDPDLSHQRVSADPDRGCVRSLCASAFRVLTLLVRHNHIIGVHLSDCILTLLEPLDTLSEAYSKHTDDAASHYLQPLLVLIMEIYRDSPAALSNLQQSHIMAMTGLLAESSSPGWRAALLRVLSITCMYRAKDVAVGDDGAATASASSLLQSAQMGGVGADSRRSGDYLAVPNNQKAVIDLLVHTVDDSVFPTSKISESDPNVMLVCFNPGHASALWLPVHEALDDAAHQLMYENLIICLKNSVHGSSVVSAENIELLSARRLLDYDELVHVLLSSRCPARTRAIAAGALINGYVDNAPQQDCCSILRFQDWNDLQKPLASSNDHSADNTQRFAVLQAFLLQLVEGHDVLGGDFNDDSLLMMALMLTSFLVRYGFYSVTMKECLDRVASALSDPRTTDAAKQCFVYMQGRIEALWGAESFGQSLEEWAGETLMVALLIQPLWLLLDPSTDVDVTSAQASARLRALQNRTILSVMDNIEVEHVDIVISCKKWACRSLDQITTVRLNKRARTALTILAKDLNAGKKLGDAPRLEDKAHKVQRAEFEQIFQILDMDIDKAAPICLQLLVDPAVQADEGASHAVLKLVLRLFGQRQEVIRTLRDIELIVEPNLMYAYRDAALVCQQLSQLNVRLAACEHNLLEALHLHDKMQMETMNNNLVMGLETAGGVATAPSLSAAARGPEPETAEGRPSHQSTRVDSYPAGGLASPFGQGGSVTFGDRTSWGGAAAPVQSIGELMQGKGGLFDNLLNAPTGLFDSLNLYVSTKTHKTPRGNVSSASLRPTSIQEHRQVMQLRRLAATKGAGGQPVTPSSIMKKGVRKADLLNDVEADAEQRICNADLGRAGAGVQFDGSVVYELRAVLGGISALLDEMLAALSTGQIGAEEIQNMLRTLRLHEVVLQTIVSLTAKDSARMPNNASINVVLYNAFCFLALFASALPANQEIIFRFLEQIIMPQLSNPNAVFAAAAEAFVAVFKDNRVLASRFDDRMAAAVFGCIKSCGRKAAYLRCLGAVLCPKNIPIKRNQQRVIAHLEAELLHATAGELLPLYSGSSGLNTLRRLMEQYAEQQAEQMQAGKSSTQDSAIAGTSQARGRLSAQRPGYKTSAIADAAAAAEDELGSPRSLAFTPRRQQNLDRQACPVEFFEETLLLLSQCAVASAVELQRVVQRYVPIRQLSALVTAPWCAPTVKIAALTLLRDAHWDVADPSSRKAACLDRASWEILRYMRQTLVKVVARMPETFCEFGLYGALPKQVEERMLVESLRVVTAFLHACFRRRFVEKDDLDELALLCDVLIRMISEGGLPPPVGKMVTTALAEFDRHDLAAGSTVKQFLKTLLRSSFMDAMDEKQGPAADTSNPRTQLPLFLTDLANRLDTSSESRSLCVTFESTPGAVQVITTNLCKAAEGDRHQYADVLEYLWRSLTKNRPLDEIIKTMRVGHIIEAVVRLLAQGLDGSVLPALKLGIALLQHGHAPIREMFLAEMRKPRAHAMLLQLLSRLDMAREEMRELRVIVFQVVADFVPTALVPARSLQDLMAEGALHGDISGRSFSALVLTFLQGLLVGQPLRMQRLLGGRDHQVNIVNALALNVCELDRPGAITPLNIENTIEQLNALIMLVQGPCIMNQDTLVRTPIVRVINTILTNMPDDPKLVYPSTWPRQKQELHDKLATLLLGLVEARPEGTSIAERLMDNLDLDYITEYVGHCYRMMRYNASRRLREQARQVGFQWFKVLRVLADDHDPSSTAPTHQALGRVLYQDSPALAFFRGKTGSVEINIKSVHAPEGSLSRVYFPVPDICGSVTDGMRERILWGVDRSSDIARLQSFYNHIDDLYTEVKWAQALQARRLLRALHFFAQAANFWYPVNVFVLNFIIIIWLQYIPAPSADPLRPFTVRTSPSSPLVYLVYIQQNSWVLLHDIFAKVQVGMELVLVGWYLLTSTPHFVRRFRAAREKARTEALQKKQRASARPERPAAARAGGTLRLGIMQKHTHSLGFLLKFAWAALHDAMLLWRMSTLATSLAIVYFADDRNQITVLLIIMFVAPKHGRNHNVVVVVVRCCGSRCCCSRWCRDPTRSPLCAGPSWRAARPWFTPRG